MLSQPENLAELGQKIDFSQGPKTEKITLYITYAQIRVFRAKGPLHFCGISVLQCGKFYCQIYISSRKEVWSGHFAISFLSNLRCYYDIQVHVNIHVLFLSHDCNPRGQICFGSTLVSIISYLSLTCQYMANNQNKIKHTM